MPRKKSPGRPPMRIPLTIHLSAMQRRKLIQLSLASGRSMTSEVRQLIDASPSPRQLAHA